MLKSFKISFTLLLILLGQCVAQSVVSADFGNRTNKTRVIRSGMFGINASSLKDPTSLNYLHQAGFTMMRKMADLPHVYATSVANWDSFDWNMQQLEPAALHPLIVMAYTPS